MHAGMQPAQNMPSSAGKQPLASEILHTLTFILREPKICSDGMQCGCQRIGCAAGAGERSPKYEPLSPRHASGKSARACAAGAGEQRARAGGGHDAAVPARVRRDLVPAGARRAGARGAARADGTARARPLAALLGNPYP